MLLVQLKKCQCKFAHIRIKGIIKGIPFYKNDIVGDALPRLSVTGNRVATATGGYRVLVCNVAIFLVKLVSCTTYGATLWDSVGGYSVFPRRFYSDCTDQFLFCQQNNYFLDVNSLSHYY